MMYQPHIDNLSAEEQGALVFVSDRANAEGLNKHKAGDTDCLKMDLIAGVELADIDLVLLIDADAAVFAHDVLGIQKHLDRGAGKVNDQFFPKVVKQLPPMKDAPPILPEKAGERSMSDINLTWGDEKMVVVPPIEGDRDDKGSKRYIREAIDDDGRWVGSAVRNYYLGDESYGDWFIIHRFSLDTSIRHQELAQVKALFQRKFNDWNKTLDLKFQEDIAGIVDDVGDIIARAEKMNVGDEIIASIKDARVLMDNASKDYEKR